MYHNTTGEMPDKVEEYEKLTSIQDGDIYRVFLESPEGSFSSYDLKEAVALMT